MSTIAEGLQKILDTKNGIRQSINAKGVDLKDYVPFDVYPDAILGIAQADDGTSAVTYSMSENIYNRGQVYSIDDSKWHMAKGDGTYEDWGTYGTDFSVKYDGKLTVVNGYEYEYSAATESWMNLGEAAQMPSEVGTFYGSWNIQNYANGSIGNETGGEYNPAVQRTTSNYMANITVSEDGRYVNVPQSPNISSWPAGAGGFEVAQVNFNNSTPFTIIVKGKQTSSAYVTSQYMLGFTWGSYRGLYMSPDGTLALGGKDDWSTDIKCQTTWTPSAPAEVMVRCDGNGTIELVNLTDGTSASTNASFSIDKIGVFGWPSYDEWSGGYTFETMKGAGDFYWIFVDNEYHDDTVVAKIVSHENGKLGLPKYYSEKASPEYVKTYATHAEMEADKNKWRGEILTVTDDDGSGTTAHYTMKAGFPSDAIVSLDKPFARIEFDGSVSQYAGSVGEDSASGFNYGYQTYAHQGTYATWTKFNDIKANNGELWIDYSSPVKTPCMCTYGYDYLRMSNCVIDEDFLQLCPKCDTRAMAYGGSGGTMNFPKTVPTATWWGSVSTSVEGSVDHTNLVFYDGCRRIVNYEDENSDVAINFDNNVKDVHITFAPGMDTTKVASVSSVVRKITIPEGCSRIGCFTGGTMTTITYPSTTQYIRQLALCEITLDAAIPPQLAAVSTADTASNHTIHIPNGTLLSYLSATNWNQLSHRLDDGGDIELRENGTMQAVGCTFKKYQKMYRQDSEHEWIAIGDPVRGELVEKDTSTFYGVSGTTNATSDFKTNKISSSDLVTDCIIVDDGEWRAELDPDVDYPTLGIGFKQAPEILTADFSNMTADKVPAISYMENMTAIPTLPSGQTKLPYEFCNYCPSITGDVVIPEGITSSGYYSFQDGCFYNCSGVTRLYMPSTLTDAGPAYGIVGPNPNKSLEVHIKYEGMAANGCYFNMYQELYVAKSALASYKASDTYRNARLYGLYVNGEADYPIDN